MKLTVLERLLALGIMPKEGNYVLLKVIRRGQDELSFTDEEIKKYKFVTDGQGETARTTWDVTVEQEADIKLGSKVKTLIADELEKLDKDKKLTQQHFSLFTKFVKEDG